MLKDFDNLHLEVIVPPTQTRTRIAALTVRPTLRDRIRVAQDGDPFLQKIKSEVGTSKRKDFELDSDKALLFKGRLCVPKDEGLRKEILEEAHLTPYTAHPGGTKMYRDLRSMFWWRNMKRCIGLFVRGCMTCQQVKAEHQRPSGLLEPLTIPQWKWEHITMDFVMGFPKSAKGNDAMWVIVDRLTKSAHFLPVRMNFSMDQ